MLPGGSSSSSSGGGGGSGLLVVHSGVEDHTGTGIENDHEEL